MRFLLTLVLIAFACPAFAGLKAGVATVSITPLEENLPTQLGGYGARNGQPATGIHDTIRAKALILESEGQKAALVTLDVCSVPLCLTEESLKKAAVPGLGVENARFIASHTHGGLEGFSIDRRNVAGNPHIGVFDEKILEFVSGRIATALLQAQANLQPVLAGSAKVEMPGMNRNRRGAPYDDEDLTLLRLDRADGSPYVVFVNYTAHGTLISENEMLISGEWAGAMQRTVEALMPGAICMYANGAEGDQSPAGAQGGSAYERVEDYGRRVAIIAAQLAGAVHGQEVKTFKVASRWVDLPKQQGAPDFVKIAGDEYHVTQEQLDQILPVMFPAKAPIYGLRVDGFQMMTYPGEPIAQLGMDAKASLKGKVDFPCVAALTSDHIGYILTKEEYAKSGYEVTASFYGDTLGGIVQTAVKALGEEVAR